VLVIMSFAGTLALYDFLVRRMRVTRVLFGMKPRATRASDTSEPRFHGPGVAKAEATRG